MFQVNSLMTNPNKRDPDEWQDEEVVQLAFSDTQSDVRTSWEPSISQNRLNGGLNGWAWLC